MMSLVSSIVGAIQDLPDPYKHAVYCIGAVILLIVLKATIDYSRLVHFAAPLELAISDWPHLAAISKGRPHEWYAELNHFFGPIARIGPKLLITDSPEVWAHVNKEPGYERSGAWYRGSRTEYGVDTIFTSTDNKAHDSRREKMKPRHSIKENPTLEHAVDESVKNLIHLIRSKYLSTKGHVAPVDLACKIQYFALDVISDISFGHSFGMLRTDSDVGDLIKSTEQVAKASRRRNAAMLKWAAQLPIVGQIIAAKTGHDNGYGKMVQTISKQVARQEDKSDMATLFTRHGLTEKELRSEALAHVVHGSHPVASAIRGTLLHVISNPRVLATLRREIDVAGVDKDPISAASAESLPYLQAVIREGMRMLPPTSALFPREVPSGGDVVTVDDRDVFIPGGTSIGYSAIAMQRRADVYGDDARAFRPERWLVSDKDKLERMTRTNDLAFGHGRWTCLGKQVAQMEMGKTLVELLRNFDIAPVDPLHPWKVECMDGVFIGSDMWVQVTAREEDA